MTPGIDVAGQMTEWHGEYVGSPTCDPPPPIASGANDA